MLALLMVFNGSLVAVAGSITHTNIPSDLCAQGVMEARLTIGERVTELLYSRKGDVVRIGEKRDTPPSPPVTLLDLKTGDATICFRHNSTYFKIPAARGEKRVVSFPLPLSSQAQIPSERGATFFGNLYVTRLI